MFSAVPTRSWTFPHHHCSLTAPSDSGETFSSLARSHFEICKLLQMEGLWRRLRKGASPQCLCSPCRLFSLPWLSFHTSSFRSWFHTWPSQLGKAGASPRISCPESDAQNLLEKTIQARGPGSWLLSVCLLETQPLSVSGTVRAGRSLHTTLARFPLLHISPLRTALLIVFVLFLLYLNSQGSCEVKDRILFFCLFLSPQVSKT